MAGNERKAPRPAAHIVRRLRLALAAALILGVIPGDQVRAAGNLAMMPTRPTAAPHERALVQLAQQSRPRLLPPSAAPVAEPNAERDASALYAESRDRLDRQQPDAAIGLLELILQRYPNAAIAGVAAKDLARLKIAQAGATGDAGRRPTLPGPRQPAPSTAERGNAGGAPRNAQLAHEFRMAAGDRIFFSEGSFEIGGRARNALELQAEWLQQHASVPVVVIGHADDRGTRDFNEELALRRAEAVRQRLIDLGVAQSRVSAVGAAREKPVAMCAEPACAAQNRRAVTMPGLDKASALMPGPVVPATFAKAESGQRASPGR